MDLKSLTSQQVYDLADSDRIFERGQEYYRSDAIVRCTVSQDTLTAQHYLDDVRERYSRRRALQDEFKNL